ncbi:hypothetical protein M758_3G214400 [Ceratodon purpureus]|uniref:Uncharacterized protein n=1 Tax=Ceratodon purpureus TaxID=3225 RepID=A0A8T0GI45_CERPU|nr:hypothetical protein KC19_10G082900 [Ceratodon purpureus]KAG0603286.1 hypothetical protein M758_10G081500 [Ceratodon purpureus]KAG0623974.1 hypothetical protein M758_3G214400 [Ceratodon purpureus]
MPTPNSVGGVLAILHAFRPTLLKVQCLLSGSILRLSLLMLSLISPSIGEATPGGQVATEVQSEVGVAGEDLTNPGVVAGVQSESGVMGEVHPEAPEVTAAAPSDPAGEQEVQPAEVTAAEVPPEPRVMEEVLPEPSEERGDLPGQEAGEAPSLMEERMAAAPSESGAGEQARPGEEATVVAPPESVAEKEVPPTEEVTDSLPEAGVEGTSTHGRR